MENALKLSTLLLSLIALASCAASRAPLGKPWRVEVSSSGGFAGRGLGTYIVTSDANVDARRPHGRSCSFALTEDELRDFEAVLGKTYPRDWKSSYVPEDSCCDRFEYVLTFDEAGKVAQTKWIDAPLPMPPDLEALTQAMVHGERSIRRLADERCR